MCDLCQCSFYGFILFTFYYSGTSHGCNLYPRHLIDIGNKIALHRSKRCNPKYYPLHMIRYLDIIDEKPSIYFPTLIIGEGIWVVSCEVKVVFSLYPRFTPLQPKNSKVKHTFSFFFHRGCLPNLLHIPNTFISSLSWKRRVWSKFDKIMYNSSLI